MNIFAREASTLNYKVFGGSKMYNSKGSLIARLSDYENLMFAWNYFPDFNGKISQNYPRVLDEKFITYLINDLIKKNIKRKVFFFCWNQTINNKHFHFPLSTIKYNRTSLQHLFKMVESNDLLTKNLCSQAMTSVTPVKRISFVTPCYPSLTAVAFPQYQTWHI